MITENCFCHDSLYRFRIFVNPANGFRRTETKAIPLQNRRSEEEPSAGHIASKKLKHQF